MASVWLGEQLSAPFNPPANEVYPFLRTQPWLVETQIFSPRYCLPNPCPRPFKFQNCISQWGRNSRDAPCLKTARAIPGRQWWCGKMTGWIFVSKCALPCYIKIMITFQVWFHSLDINSKPVHPEQKVFLVKMLGLYLMKSADPHTKAYPPNK